MLWLTGALLAILILVAVPFLDVAGHIGRFDAAILRTVENLRIESLNPWVVNLEELLGSELTIAILRWSMLLALLVLKRFRHMFVYFGSILAVGAVSTIFSAMFSRARPVEIEILGQWEGPSMPSKPIAALAVTLVSILYTLIVPGRYREWGKRIVGVILGLFVVCRLYHGSRPSDATRCSG